MVEYKLPTIKSGGNCQLLIAYKGDDYIIARELEREQNNIAYSPTAEHAFLCNFLALKRHTITMYLPF